MITKKTFSIFCLTTLLSLIPIALNAVTPGTLNHVHSTSEFNRIITSGNVVVKFSANWCNPCKALTPHVKKAAKEHTDIIFAEVNTDQRRDLMNRYNIRSIPTLIFFKDGKIVERTVGTQCLPALQRIESIYAH